MLLPGFGGASGAGAALAAVQVARLDVSGSRVLKPEEIGERLGLRPGAAVDTLALGPAAEAHGHRAGGRRLPGHPGGRELDGAAGGARGPGQPGRRRAAAAGLRRAARRRPSLARRPSSWSRAPTPRWPPAWARARWRPGRVWNRAALERDIAAWLDGCDDAGFAYARLWPVELAADSGAVSITLRHEPGPRVRLVGLDVEGARAVSARQVERIMGFVPGAPFQRARLALGVDRLRQAGLFAEVAEPELVAGADPAEGRLRLRVREAPPGSVGGILGYSGADKRFAAISISGCATWAGVGVSWMRPGRARRAAPRSTGSAIVSRACSGARWTARCRWSISSSTRSTCARASRWA